MRDITDRRLTLTVKAHLFTLINDRLSSITYKIITLKIHVKLHNPNATFIFDSALNDGCLAFGRLQTAVIFPLINFGVVIHPC